MEKVFACFEGEKIPKFFLNIQSVQDVSCITGDVELENKCLELLEKLGFDPEEQGTYYLEQVISMAAMDMEEEQIRKMFSHFYFNIAKNYNDIGVNSFYGIINMAINSRNNNEVYDIELWEEIFQNLPSDYDLPDQIIALANKPNKIKDIEKPLRRVKSSKFANVR